MPKEYAWAVFGLAVAFLLFSASVLTGNLTAALIVALITMIVSGIIAFWRAVAVIEVEPERAKLVKNAFTGDVRVIRAGLPRIHLFFERVIGEIDLRFEPQAALQHTGRLAGGNQVFVEIAFITMRVGDSSDKNNAHITKAGTVIDYTRRREYVSSRILAWLEDELAKRKIEDLIDAPGSTSVSNKVRKQIEKSLNRRAQSPKPGGIFGDWGLLVEVEVQTLVLPEVISEAAAQKSAAQLAGDAIKEKAKAAGVSPYFVLIADAIQGRRTANQKRDKDKDQRKGGEKK